MSRWPTEEPEQPSEEQEADEELDEGVWELDPTDPDHPDHDLSTAAGYRYWEPAPKPIFLRRGVVLAITLLVIIGLMIPVLIRIT